MIRKILLANSIAVALLFLTTSIVGQQATASATTSKLLDIKVPAPSLRGNLLGEPTELNVSIYLPPGYDTVAARRYAAVYLLHGFTATNRAWTVGSYQGMKLQTTMDALIKEGKVREMIVVVPNTFSNYGGAFYTNSAVTGNWEDYIYRDLVQYIDANYRTLAASESRGVAGHSMGGYGALILGMRHPDVFSAVYALSPCCTALVGDLSEANPAWLRVMRMKSKDELKLKPESFADFFDIAFVALSTSLSPNPAQAPFYADFPFKERSSQASESTQPGVEKNEPTYTRWKSQMPAYMVAEKKQNLMKLRGLFIDYGQNEEFSHIVTGAQQLSTALAQHGIPHTLEVYAKGDHGSKIRERIETRVFTFFSEKLVFSEARSLGVSY
jgi:S-formylglutathione hydrolase FrmB